MTNLILLILVATVSFLSMQRLFAQTPQMRWQPLWLVLMAPPTIIVVTELAFQSEIPLVIVFLLFLASYLTFVLMFRDRISAASKQDPDPSSHPPQSHSSSESSKSSSEDPSSQSPSDALAMALVHTPIADVPRESLRRCFPWEVFYLQKVEYRPQAIICRGNLRADPSEAYECIQDKIQSSFGNRFLVVLQEGFAGKPFFALVPNPAARRLSGSVGERPQIALVLLLCTIFTTLAAGAVATGIPPENFALPELATHWPQLIVGVPYAVAIMLILGAHEFARYWMAKHHSIKISLPYFIPLPFALGTFGAVTQLREPVPNRKVLFDLGIAGPLAGSVVAVLFLIMGLAQSSEIPAPPTIAGETILPILDYEIDPTSSLLLGILARVVMGSELTPDHFLLLHPLAFAGWLGLIVISFNLMPIGQLDGGHVVHAVYGQQTGTNVGFVARLLILLLAWRVQPWLWIWVFLLFLMANGDEPALNDVTELNEGRDLLGLFVMTLLVLIIVPVPPFLQVVIGLS